MRISEALRGYLLQLDADGRSVHTRAQYARHVALLAVWCDDAQVDRIDHELLARFLVSNEARLRPDGRPKKATAMNGLRSSLRTFWGWAYSAGHVARNPACLIRRARCGDPPPRALSDVDQRRLHAALAEATGEAAERDHALIATMLGTGIRLGSALGLDVEDVDIDRGELLLRQFKGDRVEVAFLPPRVRDHLARFVGGRTTGPLFRSRHGRRLCARQATARISGWLDRAGIGARGTHVLRHTFAMGLYQRTRDVLLVQQALRHRSITSTMAYARCGQEEVRRAMASAS